MTAAAHRTSGNLGTGLDILETLASAHGGLGVSEVARRLGSDKGNVHRALQALVHRGYVDQDPRSKQYTVSARVLTLARSVLHGLDLVAVSRIEMQRLSYEVGESVHLATRTRAGGVYVAQVRQPGRVSVETEIGAQPVVHATATGKALFCLADAAELDRVLADPLPAYTATTRTTRAAFEAELDLTRTRGYALDDEELTPDVRCVAAPIFDIFGDVVASIGISGPANRFTHERLGELGIHVGVAANTITHHVGGRVPARFDAHPRSPLEVHK
ncbi:MAG: IclR family transcriptional regulator [Kineosporiaceae bacterium]|nr:IclR family transcriptional regulator [Kineosporiaceae bacterium]